MNEDEKSWLKTSFQVMVKEPDGGFSYSQSNSKWILVSWAK